MKPRIKTLTLAVANGLVALSAYAQPESTSSVKVVQSTDDAPVSVIVTAQRREQQLQDVPMAITVANAAQLERQQITVVRDLDRISPAVTFVDGAPGGGAGIRGIATQSFTPSAVASVGIVVDNVPQGNVNTSNLFDIERVEVLRGPQGTLFGQSASAGVINIVTKAPKIGDFSGRLHVDLAGKGALGSRYGEQVAQGVVNVPLDDHSAMRVAGFTNRVKGVEHDNSTGEDNTNNDTGVRVRYLNNLTEDLKLNVIADYDKQAQRGNYDFVFRRAVSTAVKTALARCGIVASDENNVSCSQYPTYTNFANGGLSVQLDYSLGDYTLTSVTSHRERKVGPNALDIINLRNAADVIAPAGVYPQIYSPEDHGRLRQTSQEIRITSPSDTAVEWVAGAYLSRFSYNQFGSHGLNIVVPFDVPGTTMTIHQGSVADTATRSASLFGQITYHVTPAMQLLAGLRATRETISDAELFSSSLDLPLGIGHQVNYTNSPASASTSTDNLSGRIGAQYRFSKDLMSYATLSRGFKGAQVNDTVFGVTPSIVQPEIPTAAEVGVKGMVGKVGVDLNLFYTRVKNYQGQSCTFTPTLVCGGANVPRVVTKGVEIDLFGKPTRELTLNGGFIYNAVTYPAGYIGSDGTNLGGTQMTGTPKVKVNLSGEYAVDFTNGYRGFVSLETTYKSLMHMYPSSLADYDVKGHWISGGRIGLRFPDRVTSLTLYARNLSNTPDPVNIYPGPVAGDVQQIIGKQGLRVVGLSFDRSF